MIKQEDKTFATLFTNQHIEQQKLWKLIKNNNSSSKFQNCSHKIIHNKFDKKFNNFLKIVHSTINESQSIDDSQSEIVENVFLDVSKNISKNSQDNIIHFDEHESSPTDDISAIIAQDSVSDISLNTMHNYDNQANHQHQKQLLYQQITELKNKINEVMKINSKLLEENRKLLEKNENHKLTNKKITYEFEKLSKEIKMQTYIQNEKLKLTYDQKFSKYRTKVIEILQGCESCVQAVKKWTRNGKVYDQQSFYSLTKNQNMTQSNKFMKNKMPDNNLKSFDINRKTRSLDKSDYINKQSPESQLCLDSFHKQTHFLRSSSKNIKSRNFF